MGPAPEIIETRRLTARRVQIADAMALNALVAANLEHLRPWMPWISMEPLTLNEREELIAGWIETGDDPYLLYRTDVLVGLCGTHRRVGEGGIEIGYWLDQDAVGNGYMTEAVGSITEALFKDETLDRVEIHHDRANSRSRTIPEAIGYRLVAEETAEIAAPGQEGVNLIWRYTRDRWSSRQK
jgi:RimJ/RimL family protein N-acetyltransferase